MTFDRAGALALMKRILARRTILLDEVNPILYHLGNAAVALDAMTDERDQLKAMTVRLEAIAEDHRVGRERALDMAKAALDQRDASQADSVAAAGELAVAFPSPGTDAAKLLKANVLLRRERDDLRRQLAIYQTGETP